MKLLLRRTERRDDCTLGEMTLTTPAEDFHCFTMERPWINTMASRGGLKGQSCVPTGVYKLERHNSEAHPNTWALVNSDLDVIHWEDKDRPHARCLVLIHAGNYARELRGCIAPGLGKTIDAQGAHMVTSSKRAMIELKRLLPWTDEHEITIK